MAETKSPQLFLWAKRRALDRLILRHISAMKRRLANAGVEAHENLLGTSRKLYCVPSVCPISNEFQRRIRDLGGKLDGEDI